jgi:membrane-bound lytic murein transglycosylase D
LIANDADWLIDSLAVLVDPLSIPAEAGIEIPDISDSLAAETEARLPSVEELFDYPVVVNRRVLTWIDLYRTKAKRNFERGLRRSGRYLAMARRIFAEEGVPQDLVFLAHVESGFRHNARSSKRALGLWQFMRGTAKLCGLRCDGHVDERLDPEKSTRAAARHLRDLHAQFRDWYLAFAAYNAGAGKVERAIRRSGTRDFWRIAETRFLRNETRNFVPAILAATILAKSPGAYGLTEQTDPPLAYDTVPVDSPTDLRVVAQCCGAPLRDLETLNPALLLLQTPPHADAYEIRVPLGLGERFAKRIAQIPPEERLVNYRHNVRSGETLGLLARRYGTTVRAIQEANGMGRSTLIRAGRTLLIPSRNAAAAGSEDFVWDGETSVKHKVRRGETLSHIAARHGVGVATIQRANNLASRNRIYAGQLLTIPVPRRLPPEPITTAESSAPTKVTAGKATPQSRSMMALNTSHNLGRVSSTAHIVEQARQEIDEQEERLRAARAAAPKPRTYTVRRGDTLSGIAVRHGVRVSQLRRWNTLRSTYLIYPGDELWVQDPRSAGGPASDEEPRQVHVVRRGDSLWKIAKRYGVRTSDLAEWNGIGRSSTIYPGQKILLY